MYICICKGITDEQLKKQVVSGKPTKEILKLLGIGDECGVCVLTAIDEITAQLKRQQESKS